MTLRQTPQQGLFMGQRMGQYNQLLQNNAQELSHTLEQRLAINPFLEWSEDEQGIDIDEGDAPTEDSQTRERDLVDDLTTIADEGSAFEWSASAEYGEGSDWHEEWSSGETRDEGGFDERLLDSPYPNPSLVEDDRPPTAIYPTDPHRELVREAQALAKNSVERWLIEVIFGYLHDSGLLSVSLTELAQILHDDTRAHPQLARGQAFIHWDLAQWESALTQSLRYLHAIEPAGIAARDAPELFRLQIERWPDGVFRAYAQEVIQHHYGEVVAKNWSAIKTALSINSAQCEALQAKMATLSITPLADWVEEQQPPPYLEPEVRVRKIGHTWRVMINERAFPRLRVNSFYEKWLYRRRDHEDVRGKMAEAKELIADLAHRAQVIVRIAQFLVEAQRAYFELGDIALRPIKQADIAEKLGLTLSAVSRAMSGKTMDTPRGVLPFSHFVDKARARSDMGAVVATKAMATLIQSFVQAEKKGEPFTDDQLCAKLAEMGINLSRRMVAHHRQKLGIPPHLQRAQKFFLGKLTPTVS